MESYVQFTKFILKIIVLVVIFTNANAYEWVKTYSCVGGSTSQQAATNICNQTMPNSIGRLVSPGCASFEVPNTNLYVECKKLGPYASALPKPATPPQMCVLNPIEVGSGGKYQAEVDIDGKGLGQVSFERYYNNATSGVGVWLHNYDRTASVVDPLQLPIIKEKSNEYVSKSDACTSGWNDIKSKLTDGWAVGSTAVYSNGACKIMRNNVQVKKLPIVSVDPFDNAMAPEAVMISRPNGGSTTFQYYVDIGYVSSDNTGGTLLKINANGILWRYISKDGEVEDYNVNGKLLSLTASNGLKQTLSYNPTSGLLTQVQDSTGRKLTFAYLNSKLFSVTTDDNKTTTYNYNAVGLIADVQRSDNTHRLYHYEDTRFPTYLTGITDERGMRYATWAYDAQGRAISSEHAGGAEKGLLTFNADGSTTVTNELNKQTIYRFAYVAGSRRVVSVEGQPTANCVGANKAYTYTVDGFLASKTDWNGNLTTYTYNSIGQETSRTEAAGTTAARLIRTYWHPTLNRITKITEPETETTFSYDANGFLLNKTIRSLTTP